MLLQSFPELPEQQHFPPLSRRTSSLSWDETCSAGTGCVTPGSPLLSAASPAHIAHKDPTLKVQIPSLYSSKSQFLECWHPPGCCSLPTQTWPWGSEGCRKRAWGVWFPAGPPGMPPAMEPDSLELEIPLPLCSGAQLNGKIFAPALCHLLSCPEVT